MSKNGTENRSRGGNIFVCGLCRNTCVLLRLARKCSQLAAYSCRVSQTPPKSHRIGLGRVGRYHASPGFAVCGGATTCNLTYSAPIAVVSTFCSILIFPLREFDGRVA